MATYCFDLDGTLCSNTEGLYDQAVPFFDMISEVNRLKVEGHNILIYTARGSGTGKDWKAVTEQQLTQWGVTHDRLILGKPAADVYVDDRGVNISECRLVRMGRLGSESVPALFSPDSSEEPQ